MEISHFEVFIVDNFPRVVMVCNFNNIDMVIGFDIKASNYFFVQRNVVIGGDSLIDESIPVRAYLNFLVMVNRFITLNLTYLVIVL